MELDAPPGIVYIFLNLPYITFPPLVTYYALKTTLGSTWINVILSLLSLPMAMVLQTWYTEYNIRKTARALGAKLPPSFIDDSFGGLNLIKSLASEVKGGYIGDVFKGLTDSCNATTVLFKALFEYRVFTSDPELVKAILASQFTDFEKGPVANRLNRRLLGSGIFNVDGEIWKFHRTISRPFFSKERIGHFDNFERHTKIALDLVDARLSEGTAVDIQDLVSRFTMDSATEYLFNRDVGSLSVGLPYPPSDPKHGSFDNNAVTTFTDAFMKAQILTATRGRRGRNWQLWEFWKDEVKPYRRILESYVNPILEQALQRRKALQRETPVADGSTVESDCMLDHLVNQTDDIEILRDSVINMLIAGRDTTASTLTFSIYMLAEHPKILRKLREEIISKVGKDRTPTFADMRDFKYLRAVINETLRLYPPVPVNARQTTGPTLLPPKNPGEKPTFIPANTRTYYSVLLMQRRTDLWGPDALEFDPERWLDDRLKKYFTPNPFIFTPFNAGPRICLGQQFAYHEASYFLIRFLQRYDKITLRPDLQLPSERPPSSWIGAPGPKGRDILWPRAHLTLYSKGGCWAMMEEAPLSE